MTTTAWWHETSAAALLGTGRRQPPPLPGSLGVASRPDGDAMVALLDAAALGGALLRAGRAGRTTLPPAPAAPETLPPAPPAAAQMLQLLLDQPPVGRQLRTPALQHWLAACSARGCRVPHAALATLLAAATARETIRPATAATIGERGRWLAAANPEWGWAVDEPAEAAAPPARAVPSLQDWRKLPAGERQLVLSSLSVPHAPEESELLEAALDDRSEKVRHTAHRALEADPGSARAARMAARLRPLVTATGILRRTLEVERPADPDEAAVRDGLTRTRSGSQRDRWLELIAAGAPLAVWTDASGKDAAQTWAMVRDPAARSGILRAVHAQQDPAWAAAVVDDHPDVLALLPDAAREAAARRLLRAGTVAALTSVVHHVPGPWSPGLSDAIVGTMQRIDRGAGGELLLPLATGLDPGVRPRVASWARSRHGWGSLPAELDQYLTFIPAITEAFR